MSNSELEINRTAAATQLVEDLDLNHDAEFFANPENRIELLTSLTADDFADLLKHINDRVRGFEPRDRISIRDEGAILPLLATPGTKDKPIALRAGYKAIQDYLRESEDDIQQKIKGAGMAAEALIIWVHPFNDGNGRTSRFLGKFIEDGTTDVDQLIAETENINNRLRMYYDYLRVDQGNTIKGMDIPLTDEEIEEYKKTEMPIADGIALSIKRLLEDNTFQDKVNKKQAELQAKHKKAQELFAQEKIAA